MRLPALAGHALVTLAVTMGGVAPASAQDTARTERRAMRAVSAPIIDGALNDEAWQSPPLDTGEWLSYNPLHGDRIPQTTTVWFAYDDDYLYFAFKCDDPEPSGIKTSITRRDNVGNDDWVAVSLDALGTGQLAYHMFVNPNGVQMDALNSAAGGEDGAPDWRWDTAGQLTETGYAIEMRVPLQSIRLKGGRDARMGVMFFRRVSRLGVSVSWPAMSPSEWVFDRHASLIFDRIEARRVREVLPSVTYARRDTRQSPTAWSAATKGDVGLSAKLGVTSTITLDATVNPDFSQVESDAFQVEVNQRFPIFFQEKRPFFMEGTGIFALAGAGGDNSLRTAVHTRRIVDPTVGAKVTGSVGRVTFGGLSAVDDAGEHDRFFNIGRAQYSFGPSNYVGAVYTDVTGAGDSNRVIGADAKWRVSPTQRIDGFALLSRSRSGLNNGTTMGGGAQLGYSFETQTWTVATVAEHYDRDFRMDTAFINRVNISSAWVFVNRSWYPDKTKYPWLRRLAIVSFNRGGRDRTAGGGELFGLIGGQFNFSRQGFLRVQVQRGFEHWQRQRFDVGGVNAFGFIQAFRWLGLNGGVFAGPAIFYDRTDPFQGRQRSGSLAITFQPSGRFSQEAGFNRVHFSRESTGERVYAVTIVNTKTTYQFTRAFSIRGIAQYDSSRARVLTDFLSSYEPTPGTVVYVGYGSLIERRDFVDSRWVPMTGRYLTTQRGLFLKASYLYRF